jgi:phosphoribosylformimino-5-aminoimidazole carboxamide ribotide isomerase
MKIIPAVDIKNGKCVRLLQGKMDAETVFADNPSEMALRWVEEGADMIHVVDLDGAVGKKPHNLEAIKKILSTTPADIQVGGGIRDGETIEMYLDLGVKRVVIGTEAIRNPLMVQTAAKRHPGQIVVGIDARAGKVAIEGWTETTPMEAIELARQFEDCGVAAINFTDIHRDGMQTGPNIEETHRLAQSISIPVVASGGVSNLQDISNLLTLHKSGVVGIITGKALYTGGLDLKKAIALTRHYTPAR